VALFPIARLRTGTPGVDIAPWQMFYLGGTNSVRGWPLGSRVGKNELITTGEYRYRLLEPRGWKLPFGIRYRGGVDLAVFMDAGIVWDEADQFEWRNVIAGGGVGIRLLVPFIGVMRFDVAMGESGGRLAVHIGGFEKPVRTRQRVR
jgi:outer membrane translocation and assembly module TamA